MSQTFTERVAGNRTAGDLMRWLFVGIAAVIVAAGLFALGRWTALPQSSAPRDTLHR